MQRFLPETKLLFPRSGQSIPEGSSVLLWGANSMPPDAPSNLDVIRVEDGFLRSVGLGADLVQPLSWVFDRNGLYFDARQASDLENILNHSHWEKDILNRAARLRERITSLGLTKYNVGAKPWTRPVHLQGRRVVLVPGQVESDTSLRVGSPHIKTNLELLKAVRHAEPQAYLIYKPHPDVLAGLRSKGQDEDDARHWCDEILHDAPMGNLLESVDALHVMTSLAGFEALLRGKSVVCHGLPFYSGWGLTQDRIALPRRKRTLSLDELTAGALIEYPLYLSRNTKKLATAEQALEDLVAWRAVQKHELPVWRQALRFALGLWARQVEKK